MMALPTTTRALTIVVRYLLCSETISLNGGKFTRVIHTYNGVYTYRRLQRQRRNALIMAKGRRCSRERKKSQRKLGSLLSAWKNPDLFLSESFLVSNRIEEKKAGQHRERERKWESERAVGVGVKDHDTYNANDPFRWSLRQPLPTELLKKTEQKCFIRSSGAVVQVYRTP